MSLSHRLSRRYGRLVNFYDGCVFETGCSLNTSLQPRGYCDRGRPPRGTARAVPRDVGAARLDTVQAAAGPG